MARYPDWTKCAKRCHAVTSWRQEAESFEAENRRLARENKRLKGLIVKAYDYQGTLTTAGHLALQAEASRARRT